MLTLSDLEVRVVVFTLQNNQLQVLLHPIHKHEQWMLPGCGLFENASLESAAASCVEGLTGLKEVFLEQLYTYSDPGRHPQGRVVSVVYFALLAAGW